MRLALLALLGGLAVAAVAGGRLGQLPAEGLRWPALSLVAVVLYWTPSLSDTSSATAVVLVLCSFAALLCFAVANLRLTGMAVVALGLALNALVVAANGGMPVDPLAVVATGLAEPDELVGLELGPARQWQEPDDRLAVLGDAVPVAVLGEVVSFGDLVLAAGLVNVSFRVLRPASGRRSRGPFRGRSRPWSRAGLPAGPWAPAG